MTDRKQIKPNVAQILFWYSNGNGCGGTVCCSGFNVVFWIVNTRQRAHNYNGSERYQNTKYNVTKQPLNIG
jgi:hypothetical protein